MPLPGPTIIPPIGEQTDPAKVRVAAIVGGQLASAPARGFGLTSQELGTLIAVTAGYSATAQARNRVVNGGFAISQENGSTAGTTSGYYADQWLMYKVHSAGTMTAQRVTMAAFSPVGGSFAFRITITAADAALAAGEVLTIVQPLEGPRMADLMWGTATAKQAVLRFGFRGPASTYSIAFTSSTEARAYVAQFVISAGQANADTTQTFIIPGDTTVGTTWVGTSGSLWGYLYITLAAGTTFTGTNATWQAGPKYGVTGMTNGMGTVGAVFELYDVGLYADPDATGLAPKWMMPDEAQELAACQRYWFNGYYVVDTTGASYTLNTPVMMRTAPAITGGGAGFTVALGGPGPNMTLYQTTRGTPLLTFNSRM